jgi:hypothetical protein
MEKKSKILDRFLLKKKKNKYQEKSSQSVIANVTSIGANGGKHNNQNVLLCSVLAKQCTT